MFTPGTSQLFNSWNAARLDGRSIDRNTVFYAFCSGLCSLRGDAEVGACTTLLTFLLDTAGEDRTCLDEISTLLVETNIYSSHLRGVNQPANDMLRLTVRKAVLLLAHASSRQETFERYDRRVAQGVKRITGNDLVREPEKTLLASTGQALCGAHWETVTSLYDPLQLERRAFCQMLNDVPDTLLSGPTLSTKRQKAALPEDLAP